MPEKMRGTLRTRTTQPRMHKGQPGPSRAPSQRKQVLGEECAKRKGEKIKSIPFFLSLQGSDGVGDKESLDISWGAVSAIWEQSPRLGSSFQGWGKLAGVPANRFLSTTAPPTARLPGTPASKDSTSSTAEDFVNYDDHTQLPLTGNGWQPAKPWPPPPVLLQMAAPRSNPLQ